MRNWGLQILCPSHHAKWVGSDFWLVKASGFWCLLIFLFAVTLDNYHVYLSCSFDVMRSMWFNFWKNVMYLQFQMILFELQVMKDPEAQNRGSGFVGPLGVPNKWDCQSSSQEEGFQSTYQKEASANLEPDTSEGKNRWVSLHVPIATFHLTDSLLEHLMKYSFWLYNFIFFNNFWKSKSY